LASGCSVYHSQVVPPSLDNTPVRDINLASLSGLSIWAGDDEDGRITITLDFTGVKATHGYTELQIAAATLECLRRVAGESSLARQLKPSIGRTDRTRSSIWSTPS
jgi:hypothetical protein